MQNLYCRNVRNVKFPKIVAEKFAFYTVSVHSEPDWLQERIQGYVVFSIQG